MNFPISGQSRSSAAVTVIVPAYNHARYIVEALGSVRGQTFSNWEMIVIDDGSKDGTWAVLTAYQERVIDPRIRLFKQANAGSHATINRGMGMASTPYLAILNSDDIYAPGRLERLMSIAASAGADIFAATGIRLIDENSLPISREHWWYSMYQDYVDRWNDCQREKLENPAVQSLLWGNCVASTSNFFMSRGVWERVGSLKHFQYVPDWDFALRVAAEMPQAFIFIPDEQLLNYRLHGKNTILGGTLRNHAEAVKILRSFQKKWVATGHRISPFAIDRLHYLNRFIRHEHTRQMFEVQRAGWIEQVHVLTSARDHDRAESEHWQQQAGLLRAESAHRQQQTEYWQQQAERWYQQAGQSLSESEGWQQQAEYWQQQVEYWQQQAGQSLSESEGWQQKAEHWQEQAGLLRAESEHWQQQVGRMQATLSWRLTAPLRYGKQKLRAFLARAKQLNRRLTKRLSNAHDSLSSPYDEWLKGEAAMLKHAKAGAASSISAWNIRPLISIVMPVHNTDAAFLQAAIESVREQWYENWEICICDDASDRAETLTSLKKIEKSDERIKCVHRTEPGHIVLATNDAIEIAVGEFVVFLDHDDRLAPHALFMLVKELNRTPDADLIYSDEDKIDERHKRCLPFFKPDWSPVLQWSQNYVGHLMCMRRSLLREIGGLLAGTQGSQDHDLVLRLAAIGAKIVHVPHVLYHWRIHSTSTASNPDAKPYAHHAGKEAVSRHLGLRYGSQFGQVDDSDYPFAYLPRFKVPSEALATIIIPVRDKSELLKACIESIQEQTTTSRYEIIVLDNGSQEEKTKTYFQSLATNTKVRVVAADIPFNWSRLNNIGRSYAHGQVLVFLNNDTEIISPDWLQRLMEYALLPDVATVGPLLLYPDGTIQHAGVVVGMGGWADHVFKGEVVTHYPSPFVSSVLPRNVLANTGACVAIATERFDELGGFDEGFQICGSDVELGIRAHSRGYFNVYLPTVRLYHLEGKTRSHHIPAVDFEQSSLKYAPYRLNGDPFYNLNLDSTRSTPTPHYPADKIAHSN